jgi:NADH:ubiquinone oxidoreductase subunit H
MTPTEALLAEDPLWLTALKVVVVFVFLMVVTLFMIWMEHRVLGRMQHRPGPNRVGPFGLLQSLADGLKLAFNGRCRDGGVQGPVGRRRCLAWRITVAGECRAR